MKNNNMSIAMKKVWAEHREKMMRPRLEKKEEIRAKQSKHIKEHYATDKTHRKAIGEAQKLKWKKINAALRYCEEAGIDFGDDFL